MTKQILLAKLLNIANNMAFLILILKQALVMAPPPVNEFSLNVSNECSPFVVPL